MKAIVYTEFGSPDVFQLKEVEKPTQKDNEIRIKVHATTVNYGDLTARNFKNISPGQFNMPMLFWFGARFAFGLSQPKVNILGSELAGIVDAVGKDVIRFKEGDPIFAYMGQAMGAYAEYLCMPEDGVVAIKPANMTFEEAAGVPMGAIMALDLLKKMNIQPGQKVLINGASGAIGSHAVQIAKYFGAEVTGVCSTPRMELVTSLGADHVVDYTQTDFTKTDETYDLVFDILGRRSFSDVQNSLKPNGRYLLASFKTRHLLQMLRTAIVGDKKVICALASDRAEDLSFIKDLIEDGKIKSIVDRSFPLEDTAEAHRYVENGRKQGHVVITMERNN